MNYERRDSSVSIATCGLNGTGIEPRWGARFSAPLQTGPRAHSASYTMSTESLSRGLERSGRGVDHPPPSSTLWVFVAGSRVNFTFTYSKNQLDALISQIYFWKETICFGQFLCPSSGAFTVHTAMVYAIQVCRQLASCLQICMTYTIAVCTVKNSWWWTEELSETCRVFLQK